MKDRRAPAKSQPKSPLDLVRMSVDIADEIDVIRIAGGLDLKSLAIWASKRTKAVPSGPPLDIRHSPLEAISSMVGLQSVKSCPP